MKKIFNNLYQKVFIYFLVIFILVGCNNHNKETKNILTDKLTLLENKPFVKIEINDTLGHKKEKGVIKFFNKLNDSVKITDQDERKIYVVFGLKKHKENLNYINTEDRFRDRIYFKKINISDTTKIPISLNPQFKGDGKAIIKGIVSDSYYLHSYNEEKVRILEKSFTFEKEVYLKGNRQ